MRIQSRIATVVLLSAATLVGSEPASSSSSEKPATVTFNKDVFPILEQNCQECHRPGGIAPMSFLTYQSSRPWAKAIKTAILQKHMPPWFAEPGGIEFRNAPKLSASDRDTLVAWIDGGAQEGDARDKPTPSSRWVEGWRTQPDVVVSMPAAYTVQATGPGEIRTFSIPNPFKEDTWVTAIEIRPGEPSVVHHAIVQVLKPASPPVQSDVAKLSPASGEALLDLPDNDDDLLAYLTNLAQLKARDENVTLVISGGFGGGAGSRSGSGTGSGSIYSGGLTAARLRERQTGRGAFTTMDAIYAPGSQPIDFRYTDSAKLIPAGAPIQLEVHYTPNGKVSADQTRIGFTLAKAPPSRRFVIMAPEHLVDIRKPIPAGASNWETKGELVFEQDAELAWFMPHMHLRGKDMTYQLIQPDGREETVLTARFNFNWQLGYELSKPIRVTKGTRLVVTAHHDNSANNRMNPSPDTVLNWGEMTSQEMMLPWFGVIVDSDAQPDAIAHYKPGDLD